MSQVAVTLKEVGKRYRLGEREPYRNLRDVFSRARFNTSRLRGDKRSAHVWALRDVSFDVNRGEVVGIIGPNGAGKTTLLKILSRITKPTIGEAEIRGRVGSLLEVGTGFHPELSGLDNVYLNGAILGMKKSEIDRNLDEIVSFAEVEKFINTAVKHYSSGMRVRLAFAVAAHLEPEILMIDEVLSVGDAKFQKKCVTKMNDVARAGRTVLFVSHNMPTVTHLCPRSILLLEGQVARMGETSEVIDHYLAIDSNKSTEVSWSLPDAPGIRIAKLHKVKVVQDEENSGSNMLIGEPLRVLFQFWILEKAHANVSFHVYNQQGTCLFASGNFHDPQWGPFEHKPGLYSAVCTIPSNFLNEGMHYLNVFLHDDQVPNNKIQLPQVVSFNVVDLGEMRRGWSGKWVGAVRPNLPWSSEQIGKLPEH
jgi:lipopolysaccharide transport system ATP-binding protein